jgi:CrcB protein
MAMTQSHMFVSETVRLTIATGFLGGLTTFSTFSAEVVTLLSHTEYFWMAMIIVSHVGGSILSTILGFYIVNFFLV